MRSCHLGCQNTVLSMSKTLIATQVLIPLIGISVISFIKNSYETFFVNSLSFEKGCFYRLGTKGAEEIKAHSWFKGTEWDRLYQMKAAFIPEVNDELHTQNFEKFEEADKEIQTSSKAGP